jgi:hypothetical protein
MVPWSSKGERKEKNRRANHLSLRKKPGWCRSDPRWFYPIEGQCLYQTSNNIFISSTNSWWTSWHTETGCLNHTNRHPGQQWVLSENRSLNATYFEKMNLEHPTQYQKTMPTRCKDICVYINNSTIT